MKFTIGQVVREFYSTRLFTVETLPTETDHRLVIRAVDNERLYAVDPALYEPLEEPITVEIPKRRGRPPKAKP